MAGDTKVTNAGTAMRGMTPGRTSAASSSKASKPQEAYTPRPKSDEKYLGSPKESSKVAMRRKGLRADR
jgi:hypothetical protein